MPPRILVCEDDRAIRLLIRIILTRMNLLVTECENGSIALPLLLAGDFDLVVIDLMMPVMSGYEVVDQLHRRRPEMLSRTIVLTAAARALRKPLTSPVATVLLKPFELNEFRSAVEAILARGTGAVTSTAADMQVIPQVEP